MQMMHIEAKFLTPCVLVLLFGQIYATDDALTPRDNLQMANADQRCHLANLFLHSLADNDGVAEPIDVKPLRGFTQSYAAFLDYHMAGFHLEATASPRESCMLDDVSGTSSAIMVDPDDSREMEIFVQSKQREKIGSLKRERYVLNVTRLSGRETVLEDVHVPGAYFVPGWAPHIRRFTVYLNLEEDLVRFQILKLDNGQSLKMVAELQEVDTESHGERRLQVPTMPHTSSQMREVQHMTSTLMTTLDVGHRRVVQIQVTSAGGSDLHNYYFTVRRPPCSSDRRFFDGQSRVCTDICNEGFYGSTTTGRCTRCIDHNCAICQGQECSLCFDGYELQKGTCVQKDSGTAVVAMTEIESGVSSYTQKHQMLVLGAATGLLVTCFACVLSAFCFGTGLKRPPRKTALLEDVDGSDDYESPRG